MLVYVGIKISTTNDEIQADVVTVGVRSATVVTESHNSNRPHCCRRQ